MGLYQRRGIWLLLSLTLAAHLAVIAQPRAIDDEAVYAVVANEIVDGGRPYADAIERKPPLLFWTYAAVFSATGKSNWVALHTVAVCWIAGTMAGLFVLLARQFDVETGLVGALLYGIFQPWGLWKNVAFNGEVLMNLPLVWAWALALRPPWTRSRPELLLAGALLGAGFLLKQPGAVAALPLVIYFADRRYRSRHGYGLRDCVWQIALLSVGFGAVIGAVSLVLYRQQIFADAFYWTVTDHASPHFFWNRALENTFGFLLACLPLTIAAFLSRRDDALWNNREPERLALTGWLWVSAIGTAAGGRFYPHYYIQLVLPLCALAAPHLAALWQRRGEGHRRWSARTTQTWLAMTIVVFFVVDGIGLWGTRRETEAGLYVREHAPADSRIFVWGQATMIYLDAQRRPASRYIATFPLTGHVFGPPSTRSDRDRIVPGAWSTLEDDLRRHPPAFVVDTEDRPGARDPIADFPRLANLIVADYTLVAHTREGTIYKRRNPAPGP